MYLAKVTEMFQIYNCYPNQYIASCIHINNYIIVRNCEKSLESLQS